MSLHKALLEKRKTSKTLANIKETLLDETNPIAKESKSLQEGEENSIPATEFEIVPEGKKKLSLLEFIEFWMTGAKKKNKKKVRNAWHINYGICFRPVDLKNIYLMYLTNFYE